MDGGGEVGVQEGEAGRVYRVGGYEEVFLFCFFVRFWPGKREGGKER